MGINLRKDYLTVNDLKSHPIWSRNEIDDLIYPVNSPDDFPDDSRNLYIRALFTTINGVILKGFIIGIKNIFCIAIICKNEVLYFNKNLLEDCIIAIEKINKMTEKKLHPEDFSPLKFQTQIDIDDFKNIEGEFNLLKPRTDDERLDL